MCRYRLVTNTDAVSFIINFHWQKYLMHLFNIATYFDGTLLVAKV